MIGGRLSLSAGSPAKTKFPFGETLSDKMVRLEYGLTDGIQSATDMVESGMVPPRCTGLRVVCSATRSHTRAGLNVRSQSAEAGLRLGIQPHFSPPLSQCLCGHISLSVGINCGGSGQKYTLQDI